MIGMVVQEPSAAAAVARIKQAEDAGVPAVWMTIGGAGGADPMATFAAAGAQTGSVLMGTAIVPNMPRHPIIMAQQAIAVSQLAPGRFRLGIGPSHQTTMENTFGFSFSKPLTRLGEYLDIVSALLTEGQVDVDGEFYTAHTRTPTALDVPLMASALRSASYEFCGARGIPALSWVCPAAYLRDSALPAMQRGAERAGHETPPLIAHVPVCLSDDRDAVRDAVRAQLSNYPRAPFYVRMFTDAGFPEAAEGTWSDAMIDGTVVWGDREAVQGGLRQWLANGFGELMAHPVIVGDDRESALRDTMEAIAAAN